MPKDEISAADFVPDLGEWVIQRKVLIKPGISPGLMVAAS